MRLPAVIAAALFATNAFAQSVTVPGRIELPLPPPIVDPQPGGGAGDAAPTLPDNALQGSIPRTSPAPQVVDPAPPIAATPDAGDTSACECYITERVPIVGPDGEVVWRDMTRLAGQKSSSCCR